MTASLPLPLKYVAWGWLNARNRYRAVRKGLANAGLYTFSTIHLYGGCAGIAYGFWEWHHQLGWIVGGCLSVYMARLWGDSSLDQR
jgi:hypothetical protein